MFKDMICPGWNPVPRMERIVIGDAPRFMHGLKIVFASDFHIRDCTKQSYIDKLASMLENTGADMLMLGGDYGESAEAAVRFFRAIDPLGFPMGKYASIGNNDVECFDSIDSLRSAMSFPLLVDEKITLRINGGTLHIGGANELKYGQASVSSLFPRSGAPSYSILISHYPCMHYFTSGARPRLMLSGHSHAGQISILGVNYYTLGLERNKVHRVCGLHEIDGTKILVSPGIGVSRLPIRVGCPPLIHLLEFAR